MFQTILLLFLLVKVCLKKLLCDKYFGGLVQNSREAGDIYERYLSLSQAMTQAQLSRGC